MEQQQHQQQRQQARAPPSARTPLHVHTADTAPSSASPPHRPPDFRTGRGDVLTSPSSPDPRRSTTTTTTAAMPSSPRSPTDSEHHSTVSGLTAHFPSNDPQNVWPAPAYVAPAGATQVVREQERRRREEVTWPRRHSDAEGGARNADNEEKQQQQQEEEQKQEDDEEEEGDHDDDHDNTDPAPDPRKSSDDVHFSDPALALVNFFLDQLLYSFLSTARSTRLSVLRTAVTEVLKSRLARDAIASAEDELAELLAGGDDSSSSSEGGEAENATEPDGDVPALDKWDLELVWRRTRLRVMVYMRLGELEDEDEQRYVRDEAAFAHRTSTTTAADDATRRFSASAGLVSWAAAIFLTSVLEYIAEQTLQTAGSAARARLRRSGRHPRMSDAKQLSLPPTAAVVDPVIVVEEFDVEKVAVSPTLGRLWRTWRKALRSRELPLPLHHDPGLPYISPRNPQSITMLGHRRGMESGSTTHDGGGGGGAATPPLNGYDDRPETLYPEYVLAANIPLPISHPHRDVHEIDTPGLAADPDSTAHTLELERAALALAAHSPLPMCASHRKDVHEIETPGLARDPEGEEEGQRSRHADLLVARAVTLPMAVEGDGRDVEEIEVPGLARDPDAGDVDMEERGGGGGGGRRASFSDYILPLALERQVLPQHRNMVRQRSNSLPMRGRPADGVADEGLVSEVDAARREDGADGVRGGVVATIAGASAAVGAAIVEALGFGSKADQQSHEEPAEQDEGKQGDTMDLDGSRDVVDEPVSNTRPDAEVAELDKRKSLLDIKKIAGSRNGSQQDLPPEVEAKRVVDVETASSGSRDSRETYTLGRRESPTGDATPIHDVVSGREAGKQDAATRGAQPAEVVAPVAVGVAALATTANAVLVEPDSRDLGNLDSPTIKHEFFRTMPRPSIEQTTRAGPGAGAKSASRTASMISTSAWSERRTDGVLEHPAVQRMASLKRTRTGGSEEINAVALTSASIRGPEDFDSFVQGADTVKYTLTPGAVRDDPVRTIGDSSTDDEMANDMQMATAPVELDAEPEPKNSNAQALQMLTAGGGDGGEARQGRSSASKEATAASASSATKQVHRQSITRPPRRNLSTLRRSGMMAREPRVQTESTRDFADFIRSTGPNAPAAPVHPLMANASTTSLHSLRSAHINGASASRSSSPGAPLSRNAPQEPLIVPPVPPLPTPVRTKGSMQARGATGESPGNAELIDFIRSGPREEGRNRISRSVAPFRSTMDSDQFGALETRAGAPDPATTTITTNTNKISSPPSASSLKSSSLQTSSINSRSALLKQSSSGGGGGLASSNAEKIVQPAHSGKRQTLDSPPFAPAAAASSAPSTFAGEPVRKRHRNKDPYAIDLDDEYDDLVTALPVPRSSRAPQQGESLADFLVNTEPPRDPGPPRPLIDPDSAQARTLIQRATSGGGSSPSSSSPLPASGSATPRSSGLRSSQKNFGPRTGVPPRPGSATGRSSLSSIGSYGPRTAQIRSTITSPAPAPTPTSITSETKPNPKPKMLVKDATGAGGPPGGTNDLAAFLRESGPPPSLLLPDDPDAAPAPFVGRNARMGVVSQAIGGGGGKKKSGGGGGGAETGVKSLVSGGMFGRRKKKTTTAESYVR